MTFIEEFERELLRRLESGDGSSAIVRWASEKVLESYRNGITAGQKGATVKRKGRSRRRGLLGKAQYPLARKPRGSGAFFALCRGAAPTP